MDYDYGYRILAEMLYEALTEDAFYRTLENSVAEGSAREAMIRYMDYSMVEAERHGALLISRDRESGAALWSHPLPKKVDKKKSRAKRAFIGTYMGSPSLECYEAMVSAMAEKSLPQIDPEAWYLSIVGVHPRSQGKGLGVDLIEPVLKQTDRLGKPTFLETFTSRTIPFYERLGYRSVDRIREPTSGADYWLMAREPRVRES